MSKSPLLMEKIIALVEPGGSLVRQWPLGGGISCSMTALEIKTPNGMNQRLVVREVGEWSFENYPNSVQNEYELLRYLRDCEIPVAIPRHFDLSCKLLARPFLVLDYVEGSPDLTVGDRTQRVTIMAENLAKIHSVDVAVPALAFMKPSAINIRPTDDRLDDDLQEGKIRSVLESMIGQVAENRYTFRHGDYWPGNMVWKNDQLAAVIDWEETSIGDPLFDVAITRLDVLWAYGEEAMLTFTNAYQDKVDLDYTFLPWWDLRISLRPMQNISTWATSFPLLGRTDVTSDSMTSAHRWFVDLAIDALRHSKG